MKSRISKALAILLVGTTINLWGLMWIPFDRFHLSPYNEAILVRSLSATVSLTLTRVFLPGAITKAFSLRWNKRLGVGIAAVVFLATPLLVQTDFAGFTAWEIFHASIFTLFIGIDEEIFSRLFVFGLFRKFGLWIGIVLSSIHFGLLHITNVFWGGQSWGYTSAQVISASSFGFLATALYICSRNLILPILLHGIEDLPMQFQTHASYTHIVTGGADWVGVNGELCINVFIGLLLLAYAGKVHVEGITPDKKRDSNYVIEQVA